MAVGNPTMQRALNERGSALGMPIRNPEDADPDRSHPSTANDYFDNIAGDAINPSVSRRQTDHRRVAPRKKERTVGIGSVNEVAKTTSSYASRRDEDNSQMKARMDSQQDHLDSLEDLLDVMAVGNTTMQRALNDRRNPEDVDPDRSHPSTANDYFDNM
ncbi:hypothetical protein F2Q70_00029600 [Brassica cretica]|uniref:Uncharacterized protein n=2 Tax=Brassica cretica TaxID=69181 RepID=A0A8S9FE56_BRACR|nr:hypothetical protein F2Q70_00029600 [Brassica cretica]